MSKTSDNQTPPVAIIGMGCFFPKSTGLKEYWRLISRGEDAITDVPETHWSCEDYFDKDPKKPDHVYTRRGGFLSPVSFDPTEFGIPPSSLEATDTSQLLGLLAAKSALEDAGYGNGRVFDRDRTSVILGVTGTQELVIPLSSRLGHPKWRRAMEESGLSAEKTEEILNKISDSYVPWQENSFPGLLGNVVAGRICNRLDLGGTNCVVDAACASSMSAINLSLLELTSNRSDMVITGGVDVLSDIFMHMCFAKTHILSPTGDIRPFSKDADGTLLGEGVGMLVLKLLEDAEKDGDRIYAVIKSLGASSDGKAQSIYAPRAEGQLKALCKAYDYAGVHPSTVRLIEAHGTGTRVGDMVEFDALKQFIAEYAPEENSKSKCAIGSIKSMIGHTKAAAGAAGLIKTALSLYNKVLPPTLKADEPDPELGIGDTPFYINTQSRPWIADKNFPRRSGVSSFGFGGSNYHMVLEEYTGKKNNIAWDGSIEILALSATTRDLLAAGLKKMESAFETGPDRNDIAILAAKSRKSFSTQDPLRLLIRLDQSKNPLIVLKDAVLAFEKNRHLDFWNTPNLFFGKAETPDKIGFIFPGQGSQYVNMGRDLACVFPCVLDALELADHVYDETSRLSDVIYPPPVQNPDKMKKQEEDLRNTAAAQPSIGALSLGFLNVLKDFGLTPHAVAGHSYGELTALCAAGRINEQTFMNLSVLRGRFMAEAGNNTDRETGTMLAVKAPLKDLEDLVHESCPDVVLANKNSPDQGVLSGPAKAIENADKKCREKGFRTIPLPVAAAFHSRLVKGAQKPFMQAVKKAGFSSSDIPVFSNTTGSPYPNSKADTKELLGNQLVCPVNFVKEIENMFESGVRTFVEVGPKSVLTNLVKSILKGQDFHAMALDASGGKQSGTGDLAKTLCHLASIGHPVNLDHWEEPLKETKKQKMSIPISGANCASKRKPVASPPEKKKSTACIAAPGACMSKPVGPPQSVAPAAAVVDSGPREKQAVSGEENRMYLNKKQDFAPNAPAGALKVVREGLQTMLALQLKTAETHQKFLDTQAEAGRALRSMMESTRHLTGTLPMPAAPISATQGAPLNQPANSFERETANQQAASTQTPEPVKMENTRPVAAPSTRSREIHNSDHHSADQPADKPKNSLDQAMLLDVVSDLTGYPTEMLSLDMDIESDLGIDSIKKVEILSTLEEKMPHLPSVSPEIMGSLKTLGQIVEYLSASDPKEKSQEPYQGVPASDNITGPMLEIVSTLTGYPVDMLAPDMDIESDLGIDSIKKVEILSMLEEKMPHLPTVSPEIMGSLKTLGQIVQYLSQDAETAGTEPASLSNRTGVSTEIPGEPVEKTLIEVVSSLTGYPEDMLSPDMDIESDLGIDSIKKVEILSMLEEKMPHLPTVSPEIMGSLKTLGQIITYLSGSSNTEPTETVNEAVTTVISNNMPSSVQAIPEAPVLDQNPIARQVIRIVEKPLPSKAMVSFSDNRKLYIIDDRASLSLAIADEFTALGVENEILPVDAWVKNSNLPEAGGLIIVAPADSATTPDTFLKDAFMLAKNAGPDLMDTAKTSRAIFATITRLDGTFGFKGQGVSCPIQGGLAGLAKTAAIEWQDVTCRAIDLSPDWDNEKETAKAIAAELLNEQPENNVEIGLDRESRTILEPEQAAFPEGQIDLNIEDVVVITGGARGVTAHAAYALALQAQPIIALVGRSPEPAPEPAWAKGLITEAELKKAILEHLFSHEKVLPKELEAAYKKFVANREITNNLDRLRSTGATVLYYSADVRDSKSMQTVLDSIRSLHGPIKGIIHGAGLLRDRLIVDKTEEQFQNVFSTKVEGLRVLLDATGDDPLKYLVLFSSVSARSGNQGQADYAMANEVLNKMAWQEAFERKNCKVVSINWGPWDGGMVSPSLKQAFLKQNIQLIPLETGARSMVLEMAGASNSPVEVVIGGPVSAVKKKQSLYVKKTDDLSLTVRRELDVDKFPILNSHIIDGKPVVPFALITEWLGHGALHENPGLFLHGLDDMRLLCGIKLDKPGKPVRLMAGKAKRNGAFYEVAIEIRDGIKKDGSDLVHSRARAILTDNPGNPPDFSRSLKNTLKPYHRSVEEIYSKILFHGIELHGITEISGYSSKEIVARILPAPSPSKWMTEPLRSRWIGDPLALDSAFQIAIIWCYEEKGMVSLPSYTASYRQYCSRFPADGVTVIMEVKDATDRKLKSDFTFLNNQNKVVATLTGYEAVMDPSLIQAFNVQNEG